MKLDIQMFSVSSYSVTGKDGAVVIVTEIETKDFENGLDKMQKATQKAGNTIKNIVTALGITKLISTAMNQITASIDGAIDRVDTLNNFPKVMSNLGIASEDADKAIKKMSERLSGLPTTLDEGALAVQRFTSANGDVAKSTDLFLALNNAILAGGAGAEIQSSALEQLSQAYAKGKMDMMEWRTIQMAMPAQLKQIAQAMGVTTEELGEMLREGDNTKESMDEFMETIMKLNEEGIDGFQNFEQQARNSTGGIKTAITVAKTQVVKGVADIIGALNTRLEKTQIGSLPNLISEVGKKSKIAIDEVAKVISGEISIMDFADEILDMITKMVNSFSENFPKLFDVGTQAIGNFINGIKDDKKIGDLIDAVGGLITTIITTVSDKADDLILAGEGIIQDIIDGISNKLPSVIESAGKIIETFLQELTKDENQDKIAQKGGEILSSLIVGLIKALPRIVVTSGKIALQLYNEFSNLPSKFFQLGTDIVLGLIKGFKAKWDKTVVDIANYTDELVAKVKKKLGVASPSKRFRDEIGKQLPLGIEVGFKDEIKDVYRNIQNAINMEQEKLQANVETGRVFNSIQNSTPVQIAIVGDVDLDGQKVGRLITPTVTKTIKSGGGV